MISTLQRTNGGLFSVGAPVELIVCAPTYKCAPVAVGWEGGGGGGHPSSLLSAVEAMLSLRRCWSVLEQETELWLPDRGDKRRDFSPCSAGFMYVWG